MIGDRDQLLFDWFLLATMPYFIVLKTTNDYNKNELDQTDQKGSHACSSGRSRGRWCSLVYWNGKVRFNNGNSLNPSQLCFPNTGFLAFLRTILMLTISVEAVDKSCLARHGVYLLCAISFLHSRYMGCSCYTTPVCGTSYKKMVLNKVLHWLCILCIYHWQPKFEQRFTPCT